LSEATRRICDLWRSALPIAVFGMATVGGAAGCATYSDKTAAARLAVTQGDLDGAVDELNDFLKVNKAEKLPSKWKGETALAVLERGTVLHAKNEYDLSARDIQAAEKELELLDLANGAAGAIGQFVYSDSAKKYKNPPVEKLSLNAFNMLNYLVQGDLDGARVEVKRFTTMRNYLRDFDPKHTYGGFGSILSGFTMERLGEWDAAMRYYDEALEERDVSLVHGAVKRLSERSSFRTDRLTSIVGGQMAAVEPQAAVDDAATAPPVVDGAQADAQPEAGASPEAEVEAEPASPPPAPPKQGSLHPTEILTIVNVGRVPYKVPQRIPIGAAVGLAGTYITGNPEVLARSVFKVVVYPELVPAENLFETAAVQIDGRNVQTEMVTDVGAEVVQEYEELRPRIIGAAISRMIVRALAAEGARAAGNQAQSGGAVVGLLAALAVEGAGVALDKPDTRSWTMLPNRVFMSRVEVPPGEHTVDVWVKGPGGTERRTMKVNVAEGGFVVVDVTTLR